MQQEPIRYESWAAMDRLNTLLRLPYHEGMQDWAVELADADRVEEFCDVYETGELDNETRFALMALIVSCLDDWLCEKRQATGVPAPPERVAQLLHRDFLEHFHTVNYWRCGEEEDPEYQFTVTPLIRTVWNECFKAEYGAWLE